MSIDLLFTYLYQDLDSRYFKFSHQDSSITTNDKMEFLKLNDDIQFLIYAELLARSDPIKIITDDTGLIKQQPSNNAVQGQILRVCKEMHKKGVPLLYEKNRFCFRDQPEFRDLCPRESGCSSYIAAPEFGLNRRLIRRINIEYTGDGINNKRYTAARVGVDEYETPVDRYRMLFPNVQSVMLFAGPGVLCRNYASLTSRYPPPVTLSFQHSESSDESTVVYITIQVGAENCPIYFVRSVLPETSWNFRVESNKPEFSGLPHDTSRAISFGELHLCLNY